MKSVNVTVRFYGGTHVARAGTGRDAKVASSTSGPQWAALLAAEKFLKPGRANLQAEPTDGNNLQHATRFVVRKVWS